NGRRAVPWIPLLVGVPLFKTNRSARNVSQPTFGVRPRLLRGEEARERGGRARLDRRQAGDAVGGERLVEAGPAADHGDGVAVTGELLGLLGDELEQGRRHVVRVVA